MQSQAMSKGASTRQTILTHALGLATKVGMEGLTIGRLADDLGMSKSGLFAHFRSKEALQVEVLRMAVERFVEAVIRPALAAPRGERRVRALFERWFAWEQSPPLPGGCPFIAAAFELDDRPGPARDYLVQSESDWLETIASVARTAVHEGDFRADLDCEQFAHDVFGVIYAYAHASRLMRNPKARMRAQTAFDALVAAARRPSATRRPSAARKTVAQRR
jgi:AcrR family transcriptional regulator